MAYCHVCQFRARLYTTICPGMGTCNDVSSSAERTCNKGNSSDSSPDETNYQCTTVVLDGVDSNTGHPYKYTESDYDQSLGIGVGELALVVQQNY